MNKDFILKKMKEKRQFKVQLNDKLSVVLQKPTRLQLMSAANLGDLFGPYGEYVFKFAVGWNGFTEEVLMGAAGGSDEVEFNAELIEEYLKDQTEYVFMLYKALCDAVSEENKKTEELEKN